MILEQRNTAGDVISDPKTTSVTEGVKFDSEKPRMELHSAIALEKIAEVFTFGAKKYSPWNWKKGMRQGRLFAALMRHLWAWQRGEENDKDSDLSHLAHAGCCLEMLIDLAATRPDLDDRCIVGEDGRPIR